MDLLSELINGALAQNLIIKERFDDTRPMVFQPRNTPVNSNPTVFSKYSTWVVIVLVIFAIYLIFVKGRAFAKLQSSNKAKNNRPSRSKNNELGSGDLASKKSIERWIKKKGQGDTLLPVTNLKGGDGIALKNGNIYIPKEERNRHILIIAKTGSGKTTKAILPILYNDCMDPERSTIVLDSKPEMWDKLVGMTRKHNPKKNIMLFNPLDTFRSLSWNIVAKVENDTDAKLIANTIIMATESPGAKADSPFFKNNALQLLNAIMVGLLKDPNETLSMPRVHQLVHCGMQSLCDWLEAHPEAIRNCKTFVDLARSGSQNADTIMSELGMRLAAWDLEDIRATTALNELDLEKLIKEPTLLIIELRESELEMLRPIANVMIIEMLRFLTKYAEGCPGHCLPRPIGLVIDEFASALGRLPDIHVKLNTLRSRNVSIVAAIQSIGQIKANYEKDADSVLTGFSTKILMPELDFQDAEWASKETGTMTVRFNVSSQGKNKRLIDMFASMNDNLQEQVQQRAVLTPDEIGKPLDNSATFFFPNTPVFQGFLTPYYEVPDVYARFKAGKGTDYKLRTSQIIYQEPPLNIPKKEDPNASSSTHQSAGTPLGQIQPQQIDFNLLCEEARALIDFDSGSSQAQYWWSQYEDMNRNNPGSISYLGEEIKKRKIGLEPFFRIFEKLGGTDLNTILANVDRALLEQLKVEAGWDEAQSYAQDWWKSFEQINAQSPNVIIDVLQNIIKRAGSIDLFYSCYVHSEASDVEGIFAEMDRIIVAQEKDNLKTSGQVTDTQDDLDEELFTVVENYNDNSSISSTEAGYNNLIEESVNYSYANQNISYGTSTPAELGLDEPMAPIPNKQIEHEAEENRIAKNITEGNITEKNINGQNTSSQNDMESRSKQNQNAIKSVILQNYIAMAEDLLNKRQVKDYEMLIEIAKDEKGITPQDIETLSTLREKFGL